MLVEAERRGIDDVGFADEEVDFEAAFDVGESVLVDLGEGGGRGDAAEEC